MTVPRTRRMTATVAGAAALDLVAVLVFASVGRESHAESVDPVGVLDVAAPFLVGALVGWLVGRVWRDPLRPRTAVAVWLGAAVVGLALRALLLHRLPVSFVIVASVSLAVFLLGWRGVWLAAGRMRGRGA